MSTSAPRSPRPDAEDADLPGADRQDFDPKGAGSGRDTGRVAVDPSATPSLSTALVFVGDAVEGSAALERQPDIFYDFDAEAEDDDEDEVRTEDEVILDPADPLRSANAFLAARYTVDGCVALQRQAGSFYAYDPAAGAYGELDNDSVRADVYAFLKRASTLGSRGSVVPFRPNKPKVDHVLDAIRAVVNLPSAMAQPCWLQNNPAGLDPFDIMACQNGLLHVPSRRLLPSTPEFFTLRGLPFAYDPEAPAPSRWFEFLDELWADDAESVQTLQEWFGYVLTPRTNLQKILLFVGPKRSGKGTIARVMRRLIGANNYCGPTLAALGQQFGLSVLIGKALAVISDARISGRADAAVLTERLLSISGEDEISVPRKFLSDWTGKLPVRFWLLTNELPSIEDGSGALASRFIVLRLTESFYGQEDPQLLDKLVPELPGILNWALEGHDRLRARGRFVQPSSASELIEVFEDLASPIGAFIRERCELDPRFETPVDRIYDEWKRWCTETGRDKPGTTQVFGRNLRARVPGLKDSRPLVCGRRVRYYEGIRVREATE